MARLHLSENINNMALTGHASITANHKQFEQHIARITFLKRLIELEEEKIKFCLAKEKEILT